MSLRRSRNLFFLNSYILSETLSLTVEKKSLTMLNKKSNNDANKYIYQLNNMIVLIPDYSLKRSRKQCYI